MAALAADALGKENVVYWVLKKKVAGGAVDNKDLIDQAHASIDDIKILK